MTIEGPDASSFLQGYVTCDLDELDSDHGLPMAFTDFKGRVIANGWCFGSVQALSAIVHESVVEAVESHLQRFMVFSKSNMEVSSTELDLSTYKCLHPVCLMPHNWFVCDANDSNKKWPNMTIQGHFPIVTSAVSGMFLPQMLGLTRQNAVSFTKGCYLGQEVVARAEHRGAVKRQLKQYALKDGTLTVGEKVQSLDRKNGVVVAAESHQALVVINGSPTDLTSMSGASLTLLT